MRLRDLLSACWFGHEPIKLWKKGKLHFECEHCHQDLGIVLKGQKFKARKEVRERTSATAVVRAFAGGRKSAIARRK